MLLKSVAPLPHASAQRFPNVTFVASVPGYLLIHVTQVSLIADFKGLKKVLSSGCKK
jgi:hypothetical protein